MCPLFRSQPAGNRSQFFGTIRDTSGHSGMRHLPATSQGHGVFPLFQMVAPTCRFIFPSWTSPVRLPSEAQRRGDPGRPLPLCLCPCPCLCPPDEPGCGTRRPVPQRYPGRHRHRRGIGKGWWLRSLTNYKSQTKIPNRIHHFGIWDFFIARFPLASACARAFAYSMSRQRTRDARCIVVAPASRG